MRLPVILAFSAALSAQPQTIVSPVGLTSAEGAYNNIYPFGTNTQRRYQQIHSDIGGTVRTITKLSFRMNGGTASYTGTAAIDTELWMGHSVEWDKASFTYTANWLTPPSSVVARKILTWGPQGQNGTPAPFVNMDIPLDTPFVFIGVGKSLGWEAALYSYTTNGSYAGGMDADNGSYTTQTSATTGTGCIASGRTIAMTHGLTAYDYQGSLIVSWTVTNGPSTAPTVVYLGKSNPALAIPGVCGSLFTDMLADVLLGLTDAAGSINREQAPWLALPNTIPGAVITSQAHSLDTGRTDPIPVTNSNGISSTMPFPNLAKTVKVTRIWNDFGGTTATRGAVATTSVGTGLVVQFTY